MSRSTIQSWLVASAALATACSAAQGPRTSQGPRADRVEEARTAAAALQEAEALFAAGRYREAARQADSLYRAWSRARSLEAVANRALWLQGRATEATGDLAVAGQALERLLTRIGEGPVHKDAVAHLAAIRHATGQDAAALELLLDNPQAVGEPELELMRTAAIQAPRAELTGLAQRFPATEHAASVIHAELARRLALADQLDSARQVARRVQRAAPAGSEEMELATALLAAGTRKLGSARVGAVLPLSGRFAAVGNLLREGITLALDEWRRTHSGSPTVELLTRDDESNPEHAVELVSELEAAGVLAVVGPVRSESFAAAALRRRNPRLLVVSPTATEVLQAAPHTYTLWSRERRQRDVARDVAAWLAERLGLLRSAVLYPTTPGGTWAAEGFRAGMTEKSGEVVAAQAYSPEATTFAEPIQVIAEAKPDVVYVAGESAPSVLQIAPQLFYYGVDRSVVAGGATWAEPAVIRRLDAFAADYRIVGTFVDRAAENGPYAHFRAVYETKYGKLLQDNMLAPLGYDAMNLVLAGIEGARLPLPGAVSRTVGTLNELTGATGELRPDAGTSTVARRTLIRMLRDRRLESPEPPVILEWLAASRARADSIAQARADSIARADSVARGRRSRSGGAR
ncbi:MAG: ABC transporter substrate-binding protein [Gemmatimonadota bacterium]